MNNKIEEAVAAMVATYSMAKNTTDISGEIFGIFRNGNSYPEQLKDLDRLLDEHPEYKELEDAFFDLMMIGWLSDEETPPSYFESEEWEQLEAETLNRGSELLNLLLYISDTNEAEIHFSLEDFLEDFMLADQDEYQDEYRIYEPMIIHEDIEEADIESLRKIEKSLPDTHELKNLLIPFVLFFQGDEDQQEEAMLNPAEKALLAAIRTYAA